MTIGEKLLNLTVEFAETQNTDVDANGNPTGGRRKPSVIAAEYEATILKLLAPSENSHV